MKKFVMFLLLLLAMPVMIFAQESAPVDIDWSQLKEYFGTLTSLSVLVFGITAIILKWIVKEQPAIVKQLLAIGVSLIISLVGWLLSWGIFDSIPWWQMIIYGITAGFGSNAGFDLIKAILKSVGLWPKT